MLILRLRGFIAHRFVSHGQIDASDTAFIKDHTNEGTRVAVLSQADWLYLLDARRPSAFYWLPLHLTHSWILLDRNETNLKSASVIFVEKGYWDILDHWNALAFRRLKPITDRCFVESQSTNRWDVLIRGKDPSPACRN
jgi:hypothetical protein